ncbi:chitobiase/beta-hexosaminidase C-terminal domain-containing protein [Paenibacillus glufosinatiresistens]|uniref:chitobiase/beta-hexosaminidase C-terminal domain-containing protein n=1 Tax=Paenibacillus glufosinatiresistens TaxID=3070657 RepID=UPI00286E7826|nr:chitobiase/beta-hexosaminidase C-terminal domain-containing protein [Paenibacillus sp. YX.27]
MAFKYKSMIGVGVAALLVAIFTIAGGFMAKADPQTWDSAADTSWYNPIYSTFTIDSPAKLAGAAKLVNEDPDGSINGLRGKILEVDRTLDLSEYEWLPIGTAEHPFKGTLIAAAGGKFDIIGMKIPDSFGYRGLVGNMEGGTVGGFTFEASGRLSAASVTSDVYAGSAVAKMSGSSLVYNITNHIDVQLTVSESVYRIYAGGIVGMGEGTIADVANTKSITASGSSYAGGIVGYGGAYGLRIKQASNGASVSLDGQGGEIAAGGIAGYVEGLLELEDQDTPVVNSGSIDANGGAVSYAGGIAGRVGGRLSISALTSNTGSVTIQAPGGTASYAGGFVGAAMAPAAKSVLDGAFSNTGLLVNHGGSNVYTGGAAGYFGDDYAWSGVFKNTVAIEADGTDHIYTGGFAGYSVGGTVTNVAFDANIEAGGSQAFTGGIVGYARGGSIGDAVGVAGADGTKSYSTIVSGGSADRYASIAADGTVGGIGGYIDGEVNHVSVKYLSLKTRTVNSAVGGVAGSLQGAVFGASVGDPAYSGYDSVKLSADTGLASGADEWKAGGIAGLNEKALTVTGSQVARVGIEAGSGKSRYTAGGIAGVLTAEARIGTEEDPVQVQDFRLDTGASDSSFGGAVGVNRAPVMIVRIERVQLTSSGADNRLGGVFGENHGVSAGSQAKNLTIAFTGDDNAAGGIAGLNRGSISDSRAEAVAIDAAGARAAAGGIVGLSEGPDGARASLSRVNVVGGELPTVTVRAAGVNAGGIAGLARSTDIALPQAAAEAPNYVELSLKGTQAAAGGIAGRIVDGSIVGDASMMNADDVLISTGPASADPLIGGIAGYAEGTRIEKLLASGLNLNINNPSTAVGGLVGYNLGTGSAVIADSSIEKLSLKVNAAAVQSKAGGLIGINAARSGDPAVNPGSAPSTLRNSRAMGTVSVTAPSALVGGMVGENHALIANNSVTDKLPVISRGADAIVGGLAGVNRATGTLYYTYSNANLTVEGSHALAGGLVGLNEGAVQGSYVDIAVTGKATGTSSAPAFLGGLAGRNSGKIELSYFAGTLTATGSYNVAGGLVGDQTSGSIRNAYSAQKASATADHSYVGGLAGRIAGGKLSYTYSAAQVLASGGAAAGAYAGRYDSSDLELLYKNYVVKDAAAALNASLPDFAAGAALDEPLRLDTVSVAVLQDRSQFPALSGWDFSRAWRYGSLNALYKYPELNRTANTGDQTGSGVNANINWYMKDKGAMQFEISSEAELAGLAGIVNGTIAGVDRFDFTDRIIRITGPIHIQSRQWTPIGDKPENPFRGRLDGGDYLIDGLYQQPAYTYSGLFGVIAKEGRVENVKLEPLAVAGLEYTGTLAGLNEGSVSGIEVRLTDGVKVGGRVVGAMIGRNAGSIGQLHLILQNGGVEAAYNSAVVGAFIGDNASAIDGQLELISVGGTVSAFTEDAVIGGAIGQQAGNITGFTMTLSPDFRILSTGDRNIVGGVAGRYAAGEAKDMSMIFAGASLQTGGPDSTLGGIFGRAEAGTVLRNLEVRAEVPGIHLLGNGTVGGAVGVKEGQGTAGFDIDGVTIGDLNIASSGDSLKGLAGGVAAQTNRAAIRGAASSAAVRGAGVAVTAGGIVGSARDSVLYLVSGEGEVSATSRSGNNFAGGIVGEMSAADRDRALDFGLMTPLYPGVYQADMQGSAVTASSLNYQGLQYAGGIAGKNDNASIYQSHAKTALSVSGGKTQYAGGLAGYSSGIIVGSGSESGLRLSNGVSYEAGGAVGQAVGGGIYYTQITSSGGEQLVIGSSVSAAGESPTTHAGGFAGSASGTDMTNDSADLPLTVTEANTYNTPTAGGFAGQLKGTGPANGQIRDAWAQGSVTVTAKTASVAGGFAGAVDHYNVAHVYAKGNVQNTGLDLRTGGLAGSVEASGTISGSYALQSKVASLSAKPVTRAYTGGIAGMNAGRIEFSAADNRDLAAPASGSSIYTGSVAGYEAAGGLLNGTVYTNALAPFGRGGSAADAVRTSTVDPLARGAWLIDVDTVFLSEPDQGRVAIDSIPVLQGTVLLKNATGAAYYSLFNRTAAAAPELPKLTLEADLDLTNVAFTPYENFTGVFDGGNHRLTGLKLNGAGTTAFTLVNRGVLEHLVFDRPVILSSGDSAVAAGINETGAVIRDVAVRDAAVTAAGRAGGIAAINRGAIEASYSTGSVRSLAPAQRAIAGGLAGENAAGGRIAESFSSADIRTEGQEALAGGIAGMQAGQIENGYAAGRVLAEGTAKAWAGGIAALAQDGRVQHALSTGETAAAVGGKIVPGKAFFGGLAGQLTGSAAVEESQYNLQALKRSTAYYNGEGKPVSGYEPDAAGMTAAELTAGTLPQGLDASVWEAKTGFYPGLKAFSRTPDGLLATAAVIPGRTDTINHLSEAFGLSKTESLLWSSASSAAVLRAGEGTWTGSLAPARTAVLTASYEGAVRTIAIGTPAYAYTGQTAKPSAVSGSRVFSEKTAVELSGEAGAKIYYTLDGSQPDMFSALYTGPVELTKTTTLTAIAVADDKEASEAFSAVWTQQYVSSGGSGGGGGTPGGGGGGGAAPAPAEETSAEPAVSAVIGGHPVEAGKTDAPLTVAKNSKLELTAPEGQIIYYTTDGSEPTASSPRYTGPIVIRAGMTLKIKTDKDDRVITMNYEVKNAEFELKPDAKDVHYMAGYADGSFKPNRAITRYELIAALSPLLNQEEVSVENLFGDVKTEYADTVAFFSAAGIIDGYPGGGFGGDKGLTRAEFTAVLSRVLHLEPAQSTAAGMKDVKGHWAEKYIAALTKAGYIKGFPDGTFRPQSEITRAQAVALINRIIGVRTEALPVRFNDLPATHWAYKDIMSVAK